MTGRIKGLQIINPWLDNSQRTKQLLAIIIPIIGVAVVILTISLVSWRNYKITKDGAIDLSNKLLAAEQKYIVQEVSEYLVPATAGTPLAIAMISRSNTLEDQRHAFMVFTRSLLAHAHQTESFYLADEDGHFWINVRGGDNFVETTLETPGKSVVFVHNIVDKTGKIINTASTPSEPFDPREVNWYKGAFKTLSHHHDDSLPIHWTSPYWDPDTKQYILTASMAFKTATGKDMVFAANISLSQITDFINSLKVGKTGQAVIVDLHGRVIAGHNMLSLGKPGFDPTNVFLNPVTQPVFTRALNIYRVKGANSETIKVKKTKYATISAGIPLAKRNWVLMLNAPQKDFSGFALTARRQTFAFSFIVIALAGILASGLIWQGMRLRKLHREITDNQNETKSEGNALLSIAQTPGLFDPQQEIANLTEILTSRLQSTRVGLWRQVNDSTLICDDMFDSNRRLHGAGMELTEAANPSIFSVLQSGHSAHIDLADKLKNADGFKSIYKTVTGNHNIKDLYLFPITIRNQIIGLISVEDPKNLAGGRLAISFVRSVLIMRFQASAQKKAKKSTALTPATTKTRHIDGFLLTPKVTSNQVVNGKWPSPGLYPEIPLMVLEFSSNFSANPDHAKATIEAMRLLSIKIQQICHKVGIYSLQVSGSRVIFLGECRLENDPEGVRRLAESALLIREECLLALSNLDSDMTFNMGIDVGPALVGVLGEDPKVFNLWGEVFSIATSLAETTPDGGMIQVSETVFHYLKEYYLFRPRGEFFIPGTGTSSCYILAGRS